MTQIRNISVPFRLLGIVNDSTGVKEVLKTARELTGTGFGMMIRDPNHDPVSVAQLVAGIDFRTIPENVTVISNGIDVEEIEWRHLTSREAMAGAESRKPFGCSVHTGDEIRAAIRLDPAYLLAGTVYPSRSKPGKRAEGTGILGLCASEATIPFFAIGGIDSAERAWTCLEHGAFGIAGITLFRSSHRSELRRIVSELERNPGLLTG